MSFIVCSKREFREEYPLFQFEDVEYNRWQAGLDNVPSRACIYNVACLFQAIWNMTDKAFARKS